MYRWWLGNFVELSDPSAAATAEQWAAHAECSHGGCSRSSLGAYLLNNGTWPSPLGFMFAVDKQAATQRSWAWLYAQYRMNKLGVRSLPPGVHHAPRAARLPQPGFDFAPLPWAHVNERLPCVCSTPPTRHHAVESRKPYRLCACHRVPPRATACRRVPPRAAACRRVPPRAGRPFPKSPCEACAITSFYRAYVCAPPPDRRHLVWVRFQGAPRAKVRTRG